MPIIETPAWDIHRLALLDSRNLNQALELFTKNLEQGSGSIDSYRRLYLFLDRASCLRALGKLDEADQDLISAQLLNTQLATNTSLENERFGFDPPTHANITSIQIQSQFADLALEKAQQSPDKARDLILKANFHREVAEKYVATITTEGLNLMQETLVVGALHEFHLQSAKVWQAASTLQGDNQSEITKNIQQCTAHIILAYEKAMRMNELNPDTQLSRFIRQHFVTAYHELAAKRKENYLPEIAWEIILKNINEPRPAVLEDLTHLAANYRLAEIKTASRNGQARTVIKEASPWQLQENSEFFTTPEQRYLYMQLTQLMAQAHMQLGNAVDAGNVLTNNLPIGMPDWIKRQDTTTANDVVYPFRYECLKRIELSTDLIMAYRNVPVGAKRIINETGEFLKTVTAAFEQADSANDVNLNYTIAYFFNAWAAFYLHQTQPEEREKAKIHLATANRHVDRILGISPHNNTDQIVAYILEKKSPNIEHWDLKAQILLNQLKQYDDPTSSEYQAALAILFAITIPPDKTLPVKVGIASIIESLIVMAQTNRKMDIHSQVKPMLDMAEQFLSQLEGFPLLRAAFDEERGQYQTENQPHQPQTK